MLHHHMPVWHCSCIHRFQPGSGVFKVMSTTLKIVPESQATKSVADAGSRPEVSVVIPCLNEARSIAACVDTAVQAFRNAGIRGEVVVADNGSTDGSIDVAMEH